MAQLGGADRSLEMAKSYALERFAFDRDESAFAALVEMTKNPFDFARPVPEPVLEKLVELMYDKIQPYSDRAKP